ncbi:MAG: sulfite exporter TauE/SafE family protein [Candidatus Methylomirabilis oxyfera]|nr:sulfite exporter TauE/SafE family protein [Candidatus Methylomirabilis oxyfera]
MLPPVELITLVGITLFAAIVNGALGYGFSSLTIPVALLFYANRVVNPALVLVEVIVNSYILLVNWKSVPKIRKRVLPIIFGLIPGVVVGSYALSAANPGWLKLFTYLALLPLILLQAAGLRRPIQSERAVGLPFGAGVGVLYSVTTISGPPLALMFNNQGYVKEEFRAALGLIRVVESSLTAAAYYVLGLYTVASGEILYSITPSVLIGIPIGAYIIRRMNAETFRRICMSFDAWVVGFGLSRVLIDLMLIASPRAYSLWLAVVLVDACLLYRYFSNQQRTEKSAVDVEARAGSLRGEWQRTPSGTGDDFRAGTRERSHQGG